MEMENNIHWPSRPSYWMRRPSPCAVRSFRERDNGTRPNDDYGIDMPGGGEMSIVPAFPAPVDPKLWDGLTVMTATVFLEAEGEPDKGKLAVAWVMRNRADRKNLPIRDICLAPWQFSCWNEDYRSQAEERLINARNTEPSWRAACAAFWRLTPDPTEGCHNYLNIEETRRIRGGSLPQWAEEMLDGGVRIDIGNHTFLRMKT